MRVSIPPRRYASHVALVSSIHEPSSYLEEERCEALMECDCSNSRFAGSKFGGVAEGIDNCW